MQDWESDRGRMYAALDEALRIPGVNGAEIGQRYRRGEKTGETALIVYVPRKKRLDEVAPRDRVPPQILGIPTDVIESDPPRNDDEPVDDDDPTDGLPAGDHTEYPRLRGGIRIEADGGGTLGCIARANDPENDPKLVVLSNHHVLMGGAGQTGVGQTIYQPERSCCCCGRKIGTVLRGRYTKTRKAYTDEPLQPSIDAAIGIINPGVECLAEIQVATGVGMARELVRGVMADASIIGGLAIKKRGKRTGQTTGTINSVTASRAPDAADTSDNAFAYRFQISIDPPVPPGTTSGGFYFGAPGDSGSLVINSATDEAVALYWGGRVTYPAAPNRNLAVRIGLATNIHHVMNAMQIDIETNDTVDDILSNPANESVPFDESPQPVMARSMLARAQADVEATQHGQRYAQLIRRHHSEVWDLINSNWRVAAVWNQNGGQKLVQVILDAIARPNVPIPAHIANRPVEEAAAHIATILKRFGSRALARDIDIYERAAPRLCGCTYNQLLARLRAGEPVLG